MAIPSLLDVFFGRKRRGAGAGGHAGAAPLPDVADLLDAIGDPLFIVRDRKVLLANRAARAVLGDHIQGSDVRLAIRHPAATERLAGAEPDGEEPVELVGIGGEGRHWDMATARLGDGSRLVRLTDRSAIHAAEQMRADFVANASHELRTPLATLIGFVETLQDDVAAEDRATRARFLTIMSEQTRRMHQLVEDLMSLSRIEADRFSTPRESVSLLPLIEEVRTATAPLAEERGSRITVETEVPDPVVPGDPAQIFQLLQNLVVNALKYGQADAEVRVRIEEAGPEMLRLAVIDRGEGIAPEHLPRLTERFYRVDPSRSRALGGTGLGLAIVKHIVSRHRGRLDIRSTLGEGTTVQVYLPRAP